MRDSDSAELGDDDVDMFEHSEPRRPTRCSRRPTTPTTLLPNPTATPSSSFTAAAATAAGVGEGSGAESSCCRKESMS